MDYQLVIQFAVAASDAQGYDEMLELEDVLESHAACYEVDGHDFGSGEFNIFLVTQEPKTTYDIIVSLLPRERPWRAAYRSLDDCDYVVLHPQSLNQFVVK